MRSRIFKSSVRVALLILVSIQGVAFAQQKQTSELPFARGEQLLYKAEINRGLLRGIDIGELRFSANLASDDNVSMVGDAVSKGFLIRLTGYSLSDTR